MPLGYLQVLVDVPEALVRIDGRDVGVAGAGRPLNLGGGLPVGEVEVEVAAGGRSVKRRETIRFRQWTQALFLLAEAPPIEPPGPASPAPPRAPPRAPPPAPTTYALSVATEPADARVRIMNIVPPYEDGILLAPGRYRIRVDKRGYRAYDQWIELGAEDRVLAVKLSPGGGGGAGRTWTEPETGMAFVRVPEGCFQMGSNEGHGDEKPVHQVCLDGYWLGKTEVTQGQWRGIMGSNPSRFKDCGDDCPVEKVSREDAQEFIRKLNARGRHTFKLPSEAQWEYACRSGGRDEKYAGGGDIGRVAWYSGNANGKTHRAGTKAANGLGLYDMSGNVWEWVEDVYDSEAYGKHAKRNPNYAGGGLDRVGRGGGWSHIAGFARCAGRYSVHPGFRYDSLGLRLLRTP